MSVRRQEIDPALPDVEGVRPQALDGVHAEEHAPFPADISDRLQVGPKAVEVLDRADRNQPRALVDVRVDVLRENPAIAGIDDLHVDPDLLQGDPGIHVGGKFLVGDDEVVARGPGDPVGHQGDSLGGVLGEGDFFRLGPDQAGDQPPDPFGFPFELGGGVSSPLTGPLEAFLDRADHPGGERRDRGVVQEDQLVNDGKVFPDFFDVHATHSRAGNSL